MALKKSYAGKVVQQVVEKVLADGSIVNEINHIISPTKTVDMHPFEETSQLAWWNVHDAQRKVPNKPSRAQEHEWLIEHGAEYVKQKRAEWQAIHDAIQPEIQAAHDKFYELHAIWNDHAERAHANGFDPDTHPDARGLPLPDEAK